jgi:tetratricopeptide (TPR) repeat protein
MRTRTEAKSVREPRLWLAAAICLLSAPLAQAQAPAGTPAVPERSGTLGLQAGEKIQPERIQEIYRRILVDWSAGQTDRAPDELIELETAVVVDGDVGTRKALLKAEQSVIHQAGGSDIEALVPIAVLHHEAYRRLLGRGVRGEAMAMVHTRTMARDLAVLYREQSGSEGAALVSSRLLTSLGGLLLQSAQQLPAAEMFQQAVELDARNTAALLGLAAIYEKNAQPESAVKYLRRALETDPGNVEGKLRLALNLKRLEQLDETRKILEELTAAPESTWVTPLAYQELARLHSDREQMAEAEKVLRRALERSPEDARLTIQLAAVLDRRGEAREATALIEKILTASTRESVSSRYLYNTVRPDAFAESRTFLDENARSRLPVLAQALSVAVNASGTAVGR